MVLHSEPLFDERDKQELDLKLEGINEARQQLLQKYPNQQAEILYRMKRLEEKVIREKVRQRWKETIFFGFGMTGAGVALFAITAMAELEWPILLVFAVGLFFSGLFTAALNAFIMTSENMDQGGTSDTK